MVVRGNNCKSQKSIGIAKKYIVELNQAEQGEIVSLTQTGPQGVENQIRTYNASG